jgi:hypothetical protein
MSELHGEHLLRGVSDIWESERARASLCIFNESVGEYFAIFSYRGIIKRLSKDTLHTGVCGFWETCALEG